MNCIIRYDRNFVAISDSVKADIHRHWLLQMFLTCEKSLNIEVNGEPITCSAILVNMDTPHIFNTDGGVHLTMLVDPTTSIGRVMREILKNKPYYIFHGEDTLIMQRNLKNALIHKSHQDFLCLVQSIISRFDIFNVRSFDERIVSVLEILNSCLYEDEIYHIKYLSQKICLSESRLAHLFKEETGIPLKSYIVLQRLQNAYNSILKGEDITTAALNAGFDSPSHLAYTNKLMTGMSARNIIKDSEFLKVF